MLLLYLTARTHLAGPLYLIIIGAQGFGTWVSGLEACRVIRNFGFGHSIIAVEVRHFGFGT